MDPSHVESLAASVVREYLYRKGLKNTLETMDTEFPRTKDSISNRAQLSKELRIANLVKINREQAKPYRSMLEVIVKYLLENLRNKNSSPTGSSSSTSSVKERPSSSKGNRKPTKTGTWDLEGDMEQLDLGGLPQTDVGYSHKTTTSLKKSSSSSRPPTKLEPDPVKERTDYHKPSMLIEDVDEVVEDKPREEKSPSKMTRPVSAINKHRGMSGPILSNQDDHGRRRGKKSSPFTSSGLTSNLDFYLKNENPLDISSEKIDIDDKVIASDLDKSVSSSSVKSDSSKFSFKSKDNVIKKILDDETDASNILERKPSEEKLKRPKAVVTSNSKAVKSFGDVEFGDIDDEETDLGELKLGPVQRAQLKNIIDAKPITLQQAMELKNLVFGTPSSTFNKEWRQQGFGFCDKNKLEYGIVQHKGGPCGVMASVQACMLQQLLFGDDKIATVVSLNPTRDERSRCLATGISDILWRAGEKKLAIVSLPSGRSIFSGGGRYKPDQLTETLVLNTFTKYNDLVDFIYGNIGVFESDDCAGVILLLYSAILSRTIDNVIGDMDEPTNKLMGQHGYCTQEMVNLLLTGKAVSNVFNDVIELDSGGTDVQILKGVKSRSDIGLLSLFEHYGSCEVGSNFKTPRYPIWVLCSESHFSVLFCLKKVLLSDWRAERRFDLYYYDGLARQEEEIRLTVDTSENYVPPHEEELIPPIEHCIRTKWKDAVVDWNGVEPIL